MSTPPPFEPRSMKLEEAVSAQARDLTVDHPEYARRHDLVFVTRTGEVMRVDHVAVGRLRVTRGVGVPSVELVAGDELLIIGRDGEPIVPPKPSEA